jgi:hypothetical protein
VKGHPITIGKILADFVASCNLGKIVEILTQILKFFKKLQMGRLNELISQEPIMIQREDWYQNEA